MSINVCFTNETNTNPNERQCLLIGKLEHVQAIPVENIAKRYNNVVSKETVAQGVKSLSANDKVHLHLKNLCLATLPGKVSRHNAPMLPHALTAFIQSNASTAPQQSISIICERDAAFALGLAAARAFPLYNQKTSLPTHDINLTVDFSFLDKPLTEKELHLLTVGAQSVRLAAKIVDMPCNIMHTDAFLQEIKTVGEDLSIEPVIIRGDDLDKKGFGGIFGVGKAACHPPALAVLSHRPEGATRNIAWCGKGIVYDTGGLSIKGKTFMPGMKRDCGGAAGVLGAFRAAVKMGFTENLHAVFCLAENAVGPVATRPDDVHTLYSGLTVEINNTDAEGRLVLGDGVAYAKKDLKCDVIVDMATLTGAQGISTGKYHASILTNREDWEVDCVKAGKISGDLVHPMPYAPELHFDEFSSTVADMKNSVKDRSNAQVSCAGLFIGSHIGFDYPGVWLHIDMAAPAEIGNERASGYGVALLLALFGKTTKSEFLNEIAPN